MVLFNPFDQSQEEDALWRLDRCCGHPAPNSLYHYHKYPACVKSPWCDDGGEHSPLIGFALDGFAVYGPYEAAHELAKDSRTNPLNEFNVHRDDERGWHYHVTPGKFPHIVGGFWGEVDPSACAAGRQAAAPPGAGPGGRGAGPGGPGGRRAPGGGPREVDRADAGQVVAGRAECRALPTGRHRDRRQEQEASAPGQSSTAGLAATSAGSEAANSPSAPTAALYGPERDAAGQMRRHVRGRAADLPGAPLRPERREHELPGEVEGQVRLIQLGVNSGVDPGVGGRQQVPVQVLGLVMGRVKPVVEEQEIEDRPGEVPRVVVLRPGIGMDVLRVVEKHDRDQRANRGQPDREQPDPYSDSQILVQQTGQHQQAQVRTDPEGVLEHDPPVEAGVAAPRWRCIP